MIQLLIENYSDKDIVYIVHPKESVIFQLFENVNSMQSMGFQIFTNYPILRSQPLILLSTTQLNSSDILTALLLCRSADYISSSVTSHIPKQIDLIPTIAY